MEKMKGRFVGPFILRKEIGKGSFSTVWLGVHGDTGKKVAIKISPKTNSSHADREVRAFWKIGQHPHSHLVGFVDSVIANDFYAIILEYVHGGDLSAFLTTVCGAKSKPPLDQAFQVASQILAALEHCHAIGIVHRDLKPENILIDKQRGIVKLADFGHSKLITDEESLEMFRGSPHYVAPEILHREKHDGRAADVWSFGVLLFLLFAGRLPFVDETPTQLCDRISEASFTFPEDFDLDLCDLIQKILNPSFKDRIGLEAVKTHPWWIKQCEFLNLNFTGISPVVCSLASQSFDSQLTSTSSHQKQLGCVVPCAPRTEFPTRCKWLDEDSPPHNATNTVKNFVLELLKKKFFRKSSIVTHIGIESLK